MSCRLMGKLRSPPKGLRRPGGACEPVCFDLPFPSRLLAPVHWVTLTGGPPGARHTGDAREPTGLRHPRPSPHQGLGKDGQSTH